MKEQIVKLKKEISELNKSRKFYKIQSEWHRLMYTKTLELEILNKTQETLCQDH